MAYGTKNKPRAVRQKFAKQSDDFKLVDDVAHAFKHVITGPRQNPDLKAYEVIPRPGSFAGEFVPDVTFCDDPVGGVTLFKDTDIELLYVVKRATAFLHKQTEVVQT